jgi:hypothetical protein
MTMRVRVCFSIAAAWLAIAAAAMAEAPSLSAGETAQARVAAVSLRIPEGSLVSFAGFPRDDGGGAKALSIIYTGPWPVALAELAVHGAYESHKRAADLASRNSAADGVLVPYASALSHFSNDELARRALEALSTPGGKSLLARTEPVGAGRLIECAPQFFMTQDARGLVLRNAIIIHGPDAGPAPTFKNVVEVVSQPRELVGADSDNTWMINDGAILTATSVEMLRESLALALSDAGGEFAAHPSVYRTVHFPRGGAAGIERAQLLRETPERLVLKNLHGWIMSVPATAQDTGASEAAAR